MGPIRPIPYPLYALSLLYSLRNVLGLHSLATSMLRERYGFLRDLGSVCLKQLCQLIRGIFAHAFGSCLPNDVSYRCFW
jgi:hypothetical protein